MKSYIINLEKDADRYKFMADQLRAIGVGFERVPAVYAKDIPDELLNELRRTRSDGVTIGWKGSEVGCFLSHREAWRRIATGPDAYGLVFEDDVHVAADLSVFINDTSWIPAGAQVIRLESSTNRLLMGKAVDAHDRKIAPLYSTSWCAGAYIISKDAAQFLIEKPIDNMIDKADAYLFYLERSTVAKQLSLWQVLPALCIQDKYLQDGKSGFGSNIEHAGDAYVGKGNLIYKIRHNLLSGVVRTLRGYKRVGYQA